MTNASAPRDIRDLAERAWQGEAEITALDPRQSTYDLCAVDDKLAFVYSFANVCALRTGGGLVLFDSGGPLHFAAVLAALREWSDDRVHTVVLTHGHVDHVLGLNALDADAEQRGYDKPTVLAHRALPLRLARYGLTTGYNGIINQRQFDLPAPIFPTKFRAIDRTYDEAMQLVVAGERIELFHGRGETDDATWAFVPSRRALITGDFFIWASPNCGNPQKAQRYPREWAMALREMARREASVLLPGHGPPIFGAERVQRALDDAATLLESLVEQTLGAMNRGATLDEVLAKVEAPAQLLERPYLRPIYDEPEFVVRNLWRLYGGWYDGNPARLKPARDETIATEIAGLCGGAEPLLARAEALVSEREGSANDDEGLAVACHLAELARDAAPGDADVAARCAVIYKARAERQTSLMARAIYGAAGRRSAEEK